MFGILKFGHWDLFVIWFLELGILNVIIRSLFHIHSGRYRVNGPVAILSSGMKLLVQLFEVLAGDVGVYLRR